jgi:predicted RNA binding protein YcfA (HicA-like mRNA interferase family)
MPNIPGVSHQRAVAALRKAGFEVSRESKHTIMTKGTLTVSIPRHNPVDGYTMGTIVRGAGLTPEEFRKLL